MRTLALDVGSKRIGVAVSDPLGVTAQGVETLVRKSLEADLRSVEDLVQRYQAGEILVGMPYNMDGSEGPQAAKVRELMALISERVSLPVKEWDERLSTVAAERVLIEADMSRAKRRKVVDKLAAVIILQAYLDGSATRNGL